MDDRIKLRVQQMFGVTGAQLIAVLVSSALILLGIFAFIFVGISAFRGAGSFMAIVNSVVVAFSGFAVNSKGKKDGGPQSTEVLKLLPQVRWCDSVNQLPHPPIFAVVEWRCVLTAAYRSHAAACTHAPGGYEICWTGARLDTRLTG